MARRLQRAPAAMQVTYDVAIVGGGMAGSSEASVLVVEKEQKRGRPRSCEPISLSRLASGCWIDRAMD